MLMVVLATDMYVYWTKLDGRVTDQNCFWNREWVYPLSTAVIQGHPFPAPNNPDKVSVCRPT